MIGRPTKISIGRIACTGLLVMAPLQLQAQPDTIHSPVKLHAGAIELDLSGSLLDMEGVSRYALALRSGIFFEAPAGLGAVELELGYSRVSSLDLLDLGVHISWQRAFWESPVYPYLGLAGGFRQERLGSFDQVPYPVGVITGVRVLLGQQAAFRTDFEFLRILNDPVQDYSERKLVLGVSLLFRNTP